MPGMPGGPRGPSDPLAPGIPGRPDFPCQSAEVSQKSIRGQLSEVNYQRSIRGHLQAGQPVQLDPEGQKTAGY